MKELIGKVDVFKIFAKIKNLFISILKIYD